MKKSKVIIPAMALLLFSTAASITGTVAWFTASRTFTSEAGNFQVADVDGNLAVTVTAGVGTQTTGSDNKNVTTQANTQFTHGSFNHATNAQTAWTLNKDRTGDANYHKSMGTLTEAIEDNNKWVGTTAGNVKYYVAVSWKYTFTYTFNQETKPVGLYFDYVTSTMESQTTADNTKEKKTANGFRIAFLPSGTGAGSPKVWGKRTGTVTSNAYDINYVIGEYKDNATSGHEGLAAYTDSNYIPEVAAYPNGVVQVSDGTSATQSANEGRIERLGTMTTSATSLEVTCVAWFEGEDSDVVSAAQMDSMKAVMNFYVRSDYVAG